MRHEGRCDAEPVAQYRYCGETHPRTDDPDIHLKTCETYERAEKRLDDEAESDGDDNGQETETANSDDDHFSRRFIDPQPHEFHAYLKWNCEDLANPLRSYFGLRSLQGEHDFEQHGRLRTTAEIDGTEWNVEFGFKSSGLAPRAAENFQLDEVREYLVYVYPKGYDSWGAAKSEARKRAYFRISPRWPDIETKEGNRAMSNPYDLEGYDVEVEGSYWDFEQYPTVLRQSLDALAARQGFRFNSPTPIYPGDFDEDRLHKSSNIVDAELYVRVLNGETGKVIAYDGTLHEISLLLAGDREGYTKSVRDDRECPGHYHTATIDSRRAAELVGGHELAKEFKHYHMRNPDAVEGIALENPKIGVSFQNSIHDDTLYWNDLDTLVTELDEALLNVLNWSNIPTRPDGQIFVADDYFEVTGSRRWRKLLPDRLPRIEDKQDDQIFATAAQMNETDTEMVETLLTDGRETSPKELANPSAFISTPSIALSSGSLRSWIIPTERFNSDRSTSPRSSQGTSTRCRTASSPAWRTLLTGSPERRLTAVATIRGVGGSTGTAERSAGRRGRIQTSLTSDSSPTPSLRRVGSSGVGRASGRR